MGNVPRKYAIMTTINIHKSEIKHFEKKLAQLNKRGQKIGGHLDIVSKTDYIKKEHEDGRVRCIPMIEVALDGTVPRVCGYEIVCRVYHTQAGNILTQISGEEVHGWREAKGQCDHCHTNRYRKDTFFVRNTETDEIKQIGRSCLADYVRSSDVKAVVSWFTGFEKLGPKDGGTYGTNVTSYPSVEDYLSCACAAYRQDGGYIPAGSDKSTKWHTRFIYYPPLPAYITKEWENAQPTDGDKSEAAKILNWIQNVDTSNSSYLENVKVACAMGYVDERTDGLVVSATQAYARAMGEEKKRSNSNDGVKESEYVGKIGEKIKNVLVTIQKIVPCESYYGTSFLMLMNDESGNVFKWYSSRRQYIEDGDKAILSGRIKDHSEYRGVKQTVVTRCSMRAI